MLSDSHDWFYMHKSGIIYADPDTAAKLGAKRLNAMSADLERDLWAALLAGKLADWSRDAQEARGAEAELDPAKVLLWPRGLSDVA